MARRLVITVVPMGVTPTDGECPECFRSLHRAHFAIGQHLRSVVFCVEHGEIEDDPGCVSE